jgi:hypothetical protein
MTFAGRAKPELQISKEKQNRSLPICEFIRLWNLSLGFADLKILSSSYYTEECRVMLVMRYTTECCLM